MWGCPPRRSRSVSEVCCHEFSTRRSPLSAPSCRSSASCLRRGGFSHVCFFDQGCRSCRFWLIFFYSAFASVSKPRYIKRYVRRDDNVHFLQTSAKSPLEVNGLAVLTRAQADTFFCLPSILPARAQGRRAGGDARKLPTLGAWSADCPRAPRTRPSGYVSSGRAGVADARGAAVSQP